LCYGIEVER